MRNDLLDTITRYADDMVGFTRDLVAIPTENPPGTGYRTCIDRIRRELDRLGLEATVIKVPRSTTEGGESRYCLTSGLGQGTRTLYFHGHYDVVPASDPGQFRPYQKG